MIMSLWTLTQEFKKIKTKRKKIQYLMNTLYIHSQWLGEFAVMLALLALPLLLLLAKQTLEVQLPYVL